MTEIMSLFVGQQSIDLDVCLLPDSHDLVRTHLRTLEEHGGVAGNKRRRVGPTPHRVASLRRGWADQHCKKSAERDFDWTEPTVFKDPAMQQVFPGTLELSDRECDLLQIRGLGLPDARKRCVDVSMSDDWAKTTDARVGCLSSGSKCWLGHRGRLALGVEHLRLLGIYFDDEKKLAAHGDNLLRDLAGNAFDSSSFLAAFFALQLFLAQCHALTV